MPKCSPLRTASRPQLLPRWPCLRGLTDPEAVDPVPRPRLPPTPQHQQIWPKRGWVDFPAKESTRGERHSPAGGTSGQAGVFHLRQMSPTPTPHHCPWVPSSRRERGGKKKKKKKGGKKITSSTPSLLLFVFHKTNYRLEIAVINLISHLWANPAAAGKCNSGRSENRWCILPELFKLAAYIIQAPLQPGRNLLSWKWSS